VAESTLGWKADYLAGFSFFARAEVIQRIVGIKAAIGHIPQPHPRRLCFSNPARVVLQFLDCPGHIRDPRVGRIAMRVKDEHPVFLLQDRRCYRAFAGAAKAHNQNDSILH